MDDRPHVMIVLARCSRRAEGAAFGMRFEEKQRGYWEADWAFAIKETSAKREGYDRGKISGHFLFATAYPGCPHCGTKCIFQCGCGKVGCWDGESKTVTCPWCKCRTELRGDIESLDAGGDR